MLRQRQLLLERQLLLLLHVLRHQLWLRLRLLHVLLLLLLRWVCLQQAHW